MCGICGIFTFNEPVEAQRPSLANMIHLMKRRGPDDEGSWSDGKSCLLGFKRLAILDLSPAAHQPMTNPDGRYALVYNGEMYNFKEIREELMQQGLHFKSTGDTEVVLYALARWGKQALERFNGIFALAFYDQKERKILLARDHVGIKPLYYLTHDKGIVFASQYDQILVHPWGKALRIDPRAMTLYLKLGYIPAPYAALEQTYMLEPGCWLEANSRGEISRGNFYEFPRYTEPDLTGREADDAIDEAISRAVKRQLVSDVPVGAFLSGGIDSPLIVAKMKQAANKNVKAFTIGNAGSPEDEMPEALYYAQTLGVEHITAQMTPDKGLTLIDQAVSACGEPLGDYSILPTMMVASLARQHGLKVMLSGDGGDELFWGYANRFSSAIENESEFGKSLPARSLSWALKKLQGKTAAFPNPRYLEFGDWYCSKQSYISDANFRNLFPDLPSWPSDFKLFKYRRTSQDKTAQWTRYNEIKGHLTMILLKVDRASMFHSLEVRVPLLDKEVMNTAARVSWESCLDIRNKTGKLPLRHALLKNIPRVTQVKKGFDVPINQWFRGPLKNRFQDLISENNVDDLRINKKALQSLYDQHLTNQRNYGAFFWILLSLMLWKKKYCR